MKNNHALTPRMAGVQSYTKIREITEQSQASLLKQNMIRVNMCNLWEIKKY